MLQSHTEEVLPSTKSARKIVLLFLFVLAILTFLVTHVEFVRHPHEFDDAEEVHASADSELEYTGSGGREKSRTKQVFSSRYKVKKNRV